MKKLITTAAISLALASGVAQSAVITSAADASLTGATLVDFNSVANGDYASLSVADVTIVGDGAPMTVDATWTSSYGISGQSLHNSNSSPLSFDIIFGSTVSAFGIWGGAYNNNWTFEAYDIADNLIETANIATACCSAQFNGLANAGISRVTLSGYGDWVIFDDLVYVTEASSVSEPTSLALLGLGLFGLGAARRKQKA